MKRYIGRFLLFTFPLLILAVAAFLLVNNTNKTQFKTFRVEQGVNKLAAGDSHIEMAIDDSILKNTLNIGHASESLVYTYNKIKLLKKENPEIDTIYLGIGFQSFSDFYDGFTIGPHILKKHLFILPLTIQLELLSKVKKPIHILAKWTGEELKTNFKGKRNPKYWLGKFNNYYDNVTISDKAVNRRVNLHYFKRREVRGISDYNVLYFKKIVEYAHKNNIHLVVLNTPLHKKYSKQVPNSFKEFYYKIIKEHKLQLIEFEQLQLKDSDFLPDGDHVSKSGAVLVSEYLNNIH